MNVIPLGPLMLNFEMLVFILSSYVGYVAVTYRSRRLAIDGNVIDKYVHAFLLGFIIWKGSLIIFDPISVIQYPRSLLYFSGGVKGLWLAVGISTLFLWIRTRKDATSIKMNLDLMVAGWIAGSSLYQLLLIIVDVENVLYHISFVGLNLVLAFIVYTKKSATRKNGLTLIIVLVLVAWATSDYIKDNQLQQAISNQQSNVEGIKVGIKKGYQAPDFELTTLNEKRMKLSDFSGKIVVLNFWATWCPPCRAEMPYMEKFYKEYGEDVVVLGVNLTYTEKKRSDVTDFAEKLGLTFPIMMDVEGDVTSTYQIIAYPTSYIIDSRGIIQEIFEGAVNDELIEKAVSKIN